VNGAIQAFAPVLQRTLGEKSQLETRLASPHHVQIGRGQDQQVLNLVPNAVDAMPGGGTLTIATRG
jgi:hypothetical protein